jgi:hypothetical protein
MKLKLQTPKLQSFTLKSKSSRTQRNGGRYIYDGFNVYTDSNLSETIDEFFSTNKIYNLSFKCRTWTKLKNFVSKVEEASLKKSFSLEDSAVVKYSHKAGCSCGCSPGFRVRKTLKSLNEFRNHDVCVKLDYDLATIKAALPVFENMLAEEIAAHA